MVTACLWHTVHVSRNAHTESTTNGVQLKTRILCYTLQNLCESVTLTCVRDLKVVCGVVLKCFVNEAEQITRDFCEIKSNRKVYNCTYKMEKLGWLRKV